MANETMRTFMLDGKKKGVTLDASTWKAVDWIADQRGIKWTDLAREWIAAGIEHDRNMTRVIRSAVIDTLMDYPLFEERAEQLEEQLDPIQPMLGMTTDDNFTYALEQMTEHGEFLGHYDYVGFRITTGVNEYGYVTFYIENGVRGQPNAIITTRHSLADFLAGSRKK